MFGNRDGFRWNAGMTKALTQVCVVGVAFDARTRNIGEWRAAQA